MTTPRLISFLLLAFTLVLRGADSGGYLNFEVGLNIANDLETDATSGGVSASGELKLDPGFRIGIAQGFILNRLLALELESGFVYNPIDIDDADDAWFGQVPILLNLVFRYDCECRFTPFIGVGGGGSASIFDITVPTGTGSASDTEINFVPAWQGIAGVRYQFNDHLALGAIYKYFGTGSPKFDIGGGELEMDPVHNHFIGLHLNFTY